MEFGTDRRRVEQYLLRELGNELELLEKKAAYADADKYTLFVYWRLREFHWTLSRFLQKLTPAAKRRLRPHHVLSGALTSPAKGRRLLFDMTDTAQRGKVTGIQRVVRQIARNVVETGAGLPVVIEGGRLFSYYRHPSLPEQVDIAEGDQFVMLDAGWNRVADYPPIMREISRKGGTNIVCLYDMIPLMFSQAFAPALVRSFGDWFDEIALQSDALVAISRSTANEFTAYLEESGRSAKENFRVGWWPLGADFETALTSSVSKKALDLAKGDPFFLSVGSLEPRKAYPLALDAFERLWRSGEAVAYVIVGRRGWNARATEKRIREHPEYNRRLFWFDNAGDEDLRFLYEHARGAVCASFAEGFGLPMIEAAHYGVPVIAADIPVFREVGGEGAVFFDLLDAESLAARVKETLTAQKVAPKTSGVSWLQSTQELVRILRDDAYQMRLG